MNVLIVIVLWSKIWILSITCCSITNYKIFNFVCVCVCVRCVFLSLIKIKNFVYLHKLGVCISFPWSYLLLLHWWHLFSKVCMLNTSLAATSKEVVRQKRGSAAQKGSTFHHLYAQHHMLRKSLSGFSVRRAWLFSMNAGKFSVGCLPSGRGGLSQ